MAERTSCSEYLTESIGKFLPDVRASIDYFRVCLASTLLLFPLWVSVKSPIYVTLDGTHTVSLSTSTMLIAVDSIKNVARFEGTALLKKNEEERTTRTHQTQTPKKKRRKSKAKGSELRIPFDKPHPTSLRSLPPSFFFFVFHLSSTLSLFLSISALHPLSLVLPRAQNTQTCNKHTHTSIIHTEKRATSALLMGVQWGDVVSLA